MSKTTASKPIVFTRICAGEYIGSVPGQPGMGWFEVVRLWTGTHWAWQASSSECDEWRSNENTKREAVALCQRLAEEKRSLLFSGTGLTPLIQDLS